MNEHVVAAGPLDESIALGGIKPLHSTFFFHYTFSQLRKVFSQIALVWSSTRIVQCEMSLNGGSDSNTG
jgi:hypothetical protein